MPKRAGVDKMGMNIRVLFRTRGMEGVTGKAGTTAATRAARRGGIARCGTGKCTEGTAGRLREERRGGIPREAKQKHGKAYSTTLQKQVNKQE